MTDAAIRSLPARASMVRHFQDGPREVGAGDSRSVRGDVSAPVEVRARWDRAFIAAVIAMQELAPADASVFSLLRDEVPVAERAGTYRISVEPANPAPPPTLRKNGEGAATTIASDA